MLLLGGLSWLSEVIELTGELLNERPAVELRAASAGYRGERNWRRDEFLIVEAIEATRVLWEGMIGGGGC